MIEGRYNNKWGYDHVGGDVTVEKVKVIHSYLTLYRPWNSPGQNTGVGSLSLLQGIFLTQGANPGLLQCRWILYQLSHKGSPCKMLGWMKH